jgi:hypothetical protein
VEEESYPLKALCKYEIQVQIHGSLRLSRMDILIKTTFHSGPRLFPSRDFVLLTEVGSWTTSFPIFTTIMGAMCGVVLLIKEIHIV